MSQHVHKRSFSLMFSPNDFLTFARSVYLCFAIDKIRALDQFIVCQKDVSILAPLGTASPAHDLLYGS